MGVRASLEPHIYDKDDVIVQCDLSAGGEEMLKGKTIRNKQLKQELSIILPMLKLIRPQVSQRLGPLCFL